jgi:hypothetical protein
MGQGCDQGKEEASRGNFNILEKLRIYLLKDTEILARESDPLEKRGSH